MEEDNKGKIEIVEHKESKYDDLKPRTEQSDLTKTEIKELKGEKVEQEELPRETNKKPKKTKKNKPIIIILLVILALLTIGGYALYRRVQEEIQSQWYKPIIYIYPKEEINVEIKVSNPEKLSVSYPKYKDGWQVKALTDGTLIDKNNKKYYALYWEGNDSDNKVKEDGFIVKGEDVSSFLEEKLEILGLNYKETNEFIMYWLPKLEKNKYNYIRFMAKEEIDNYMKLDINPTPDTLIRVMMEYKPLTKKIEVKEQKLTKVEREGYTIVEWGGTEIK